ncbi:MAG: hypothetical protein ACRENP_14385 [Longimicrobiales bacterium]
MSPVNLHTVVAATTRAIQRHALFAIAGAVAALIAVLLGVSWISAGLDLWPAPSAVPLVLEVITAVSAAAVVFWGLNRLRGASSETSVAASGENAVGLPPGSVRGVLELSRKVPEGTSPALFRQAEAELNRRIAGVTPAHFSGQIGARVRRRRLQTWSFAAVLVVTVIALGMVSPARSRAGWAPLLRPVKHLAPPPLPAISVEPGHAEVPRGTALTVRVRAPQREAVLLEWRSAGAVRREETVDLEQGIGTTEIPAVDAPVRYWVVAPDGAVSDTFTVRPTDPLLVSDLTIDVTYPGYLNRLAEQFQGELPSLQIPEGTELRIEGRATRALGSAILSADSGAVKVELRVDGGTFNGRWVPRQSGKYEWQFASRSGTRAELVPPPFQLHVVPDLPPQVEVTYPGSDTTLTAELQQPIVADAQDDHGLLSAVLISWRTSSLGQRDPAVETPLTLEGDADRAFIRGALDARERRLLPGDTLSYFIRVMDNSPRRQTADSRTYRLRLPSMDELRDQSDDQASELTRQLEELSRSARDLEKATRDLNRRSASQSQSRSDRSGQGSSQGSPGDRLDYQKAEQTRSLLDRQEQMLNDVDQMRQRVQSLERAMEAAGLRDPELQKRLQEMRELYDKMLTPELKKKLEELKQNVDKMDPEQVQKSLEELAKQQQEFREQLERSLELMRRAAAEQEMNALSQEAKELATQQQAVADQMKQVGKPSPDQVEKQKELEQKTREMNRALEELMKKLGQQGESGAAQKTGEAKDQSEQAAGDMQKAVEQARQQSQQAAQSGQQAADKLNDAAGKLDQARKQMADGWKKEVQETMDKATNDALSLAQKQNEILERMQQEMKTGNQPQQSGQSATPPQQQQAGQQAKGQQTGQQQSGQQQSGQQQSGQQQSGQQQSGQQRAGQQQAGQQGQQQQGAQQQAGQQQSGQQQGGQQQGGQQQQGQQGSQQVGQGGGTQQLKNDQAAVKQGLEQLGQNLSDAGQRSAMVNRDVGSALGRANLSMDQTLKALENGNKTPVNEAQQTLDALNRLALALLQNQQQLNDAQSGTGLQQALEQLAELAKQQGGINGQSGSLAPLNLAPQVMSDQLNRLAKQQRDVAQKLDGMNNIGGREDPLGRLDELAREANQLARDLEGGRLTPQTLARQERLFHRLLDAGRTLERDEYSDERKAERPGAIPPHVAKALKPGLLEENLRFAVPSEEVLRGLPPAYRRLLLDYIERLNRVPAPVNRENK